MKCRDDERDDLGWHENLYQGRTLTREWSFLRKDALWQGGRHLLLIATADRQGQYYVTRLGSCSRGGRAPTSNRQFKVANLRLLREPILLNELLDGIPSHLKRYLVPEGQLPEGTGKAIRNRMLELRPELREVVDQIQGTDATWRIGDSTAGQAIALQRDGTLISARMAGFQAPQLADWDPPAEMIYDDQVPRPFLSMVDGSSGDPSALEDHLILRDTQTMLGWPNQSEPTGHVAWSEFREHDRTLLVANANRTATENLLGCDVVFYNVDRQSMVLVQYKKLNAERNGYYYPASDRSLAKELSRMKALDRYAEKVGENSDIRQRLYAGPSWIKLCHPRSVIPRTSEMIHGMYFSRPQFESLSADDRLKDGKKSAVRFGYSNVPGYLDNTIFTRLVESGQIGTVGTSTNLVRQQVIRSFRGERSLVFAALYGEEPPQAKRNEQRRKS